MERKRQWTPTKETNEYLQRIKTKELSNFLNSIIELMNLYDLDYLELRDIIVFYNKYKSKIEQLEDLLYSGELMKNINMISGASVQGQVIPQQVAGLPKEDSPVKDYDDDTKQALVDMDFD